MASRPVLPGTRLGERVVDRCRVHQLRQGLHRDAPFESAAWMIVTAALLGLEASLRPMRRRQKLAETQNTPVLPSPVIAKSYQSPAIPSGHTCAFERS